MSDMWTRAVELKIGDDDSGMDLSSLRISFDVDKKDESTPNTAVISVYNVSRGTYNKVAKEFTRVTLSAGYKDNHSLIFNGTIKQVVFRKENATDSVMVILAGDGDIAYNYSVTNTTLAAGSSQKDVIYAAMQGYNTNGVSSGFNGIKDAPSLPRGKVMFGASRDFLQNASLNTGLDFSVQDGQAQFVASKGSLPLEAVILNSKSGLVGVPAQTQDGITATCLLNPSLKVGGVVKINESDVQEMIINPDAAADTPPAAIDADGLYRIYSVRYNGDTHGNDWYCSLVLLSINDTAPDDNKVTG